jgi:hypothetical protein
LPSEIPQELENAWVFPPRLAARPTTPNGPPLGININVDVNAGEWFVRIRRLTKE